MLKEAQDFWRAIEGKVRRVCRDENAQTLKCDRFDVTTAPNGTVIGVKRPFGNNEIFLPYASACANAVVGDTVLVIWWGGMSTAKAWYMGTGPV